MTAARVTTLPAGSIRWALSAVAAAALVAATTADAAADAPKVSTKITPKGEVVASVTVAAAPAAVREVLGSAERSHGLSPFTVSAKATPDGSCERVKLKTRGLLSPFELETRRCPTASGWKETLVASAHFVEYWNEWVVEDAGAGSTTVTFRTRTMPNVAVPEAIIQTETKRVLAKLMHNLTAAVAGG
ncbi:SRPBCC family protein [Nannocystis punicea]|uniref:Polyketide cyclase / dehydrase and lipid transport n=1 Tax=Nannocystis punicea TaxID=2995304 RepID=A0ABY7HA59_9BACT|nr:hypothetical protein [Nannocystis poenicansa]WAS95980.1 hypothetical protein O0S08_07425 [Nannocystis poenicansa]